MRNFNYTAIEEQKWDSEILNLIAAIYKEAGKQEMCLKQRPEEMEKLVEFAKGYGAKGLAYLAVNADGTYKSSFAKFIPFVIISYYKFKEN